MIIVDTNIIAYLLIPNEKYTGTADKLFEKDKIWIAPNLWQHEFRSVLGGYLRKNIISRSVCISIYEHALSLIESYDYRDFESVFMLIESSRLSSYDCTFVAFANSLQLPLVTEDKKIRHEFPAVARSMRDFAETPFS